MQIKLNYPVKCYINTKHSERDNDNIYFWYLKCDVLTICLCCYFYLSIGYEYFFHDKIRSLIPLPVQQQMGCWGKERQRKLHAESTPSSCGARNTISVSCEQNYLKINVTVTTNRYIQIIYEDIVRFSWHQFFTYLPLHLLAFVDCSCCGCSDLCRCSRLPPA